MNSRVSLPRSPIQSTNPWWQAIHRRVSEFVSNFYSHTGSFNWLFIYAIGSWQVLSLIRVPAIHVILEYMRRQAIFLLVVTLIFELVYKLTRSIM